MKTLILAAFAAIVHAGVAVTPGWDNINAERKEFPPQKILWTADFSAAKLELREGAEGRIRVVERDGRKKLEVVKSNASGYMLITAPAFTVSKGAKLRTYAYCECDDGDSEEGGAYLRLWGSKEDLTYFKGLDGRGSGGPRMDKMVNSTPGTRIRKLAHRIADKTTGTSITAAIVVSGPASTSWWSDWGVEDFNASNKAWGEFRHKLEPPTVDFGMVPEDEFARMIAADTDHTSTISKEGDFARLRIDGAPVAPVIFKGQTQKDGRLTYAGGLHDKEGVNIQCVSVRFGRTIKNPLGMWTKDGFESAIGIDLVSKAMRLASKSRFILQIDLSAYPEWADRHPDEVWMLQDGRKVYGQHVHADFKVEQTLPKGKWYWPSYHSLVWRGEVKECLAKFIAELKRTGLSKRIVGVHLSGYHDAQFATRHPDFSAPALAGFREWQKAKYGEVRWQGAPVYGNDRLLDPEKDAHQIAYLTFVKQGPFHMQEDVARHIRKCFGKQIVIGRYCMGWGAAAFNGALDLDPFVLSKDIDFLVAQPSYSHRVPGVAIGARIPTRSFHEHGKLFVNEFDLRTYGGVHGTESELRVLGLSQATDFPMWQSIHRKLAGQMLAQRMGWWYLDMSGTWFSPPEIVKDIALINSQVLKAEAATAKGGNWHPSVAVAVDEQGLLCCNSITHYYSSVEKAAQDQIRVFSGSGVPYEMWLADDFVRNPELASKYKVVVFADMHFKDAARKTMLARLESAGVKCVFIDGTRRISPSEFAETVRKAGGYVPTRDGLQVDMNGNFISVHALKGGRYDFKLPRRCSVVNMKTGKEETDGSVLKLDLLAGETCWFAMKKSTKAVKK